MEPVRNEFFHRVDGMVQILDVMQLIPGALFMIKDLDSRYVYMSEALRRAIHVAPGEEVVGKTDFDLFPRIVARNFRENDLRVFRHGKPLVNEIHAVMFFRHEPLWAISSKYPLRDRDGIVVGLITINEPYDRVVGDDDGLSRLLPAIEHMTKRFAEKITVGGLAKLCGYSERHFMRMFRSRMGKSVRQFLEETRLFHALEALKHSNRPVSALAEECGFHDPSAFVKRFKRFTGQTPLQYRRQQQAGYKVERVRALPERV